MTSESVPQNDNVLENAPELRVYKTSKEIKDVADSYYGAAVEVRDIDGNREFQEMRTPDPEGVSIHDFYKEIVDTLDAVLASGAKIVALDATSRSGKTEGILINAGAFADKMNPPELRMFATENTLTGRHNGLFTDGQTFMSNEAADSWLLNEIYRSERIDAESLDEIDHVIRGRLVIIDEWNPSEDCARMVRMLADTYDCQVVIAQGGLQSNGSRKQIRDTLETFADVSISTVEASPKPLNRGQMGEFFDIRMGCYELENGPIVTKERLKKVWTVLSDRLHEIRYPMGPLRAHFLLESILVSLDENKVSYVRDIEESVEKKDDARLKALIEEYIINGGERFVQS